MVQWILCVIHVMAVVVAVKCTRLHDDKGVTGTNGIGTSDDILYHTFEPIPFTCDEKSTSKKHGEYNWYLDGLHLTKEHRHFMKFWRVVKVSHDGGRYHDNVIVLEAQPSPKTSSTLFCTRKKGRYANNVVRVFNLVRDIERIPTDKVLGRHADRIQKCPLLMDQKLILTCAAAIKYINVSNWIWTRNDMQIDEHSSQLTATKPGEYTCSYQKIKKGASVHLLTFKVKRPPKVKKTRIMRDWAFCKYNKLPVGPKSMALQSSGAS